MISSKNKNRVVLPSRPEPPSMDQILEDIQRAAAEDPVFSILDQKEHGEEEELCSALVMEPSSSWVSQMFSRLVLMVWDSAVPSEPVLRPDSQVELRFQQCRRYLGLNERLEEAQTALLLQREGLQATGEGLEKEVAQVKGQIQWNSVQGVKDVSADLWHQCSNDPRSRVMWVEDFSC